MLLRSTEGDNHFPVILPVDGDGYATLLSNAEGTITVLHFLCLYLVLWCCEVHSRFRPVEGIALNCWVKTENVSSKHWVLIRGLASLHQVSLDAVEVHLFVRFRFAVTCVISHIDTIPTTNKYALKKE